MPTPPQKPASGGAALLDLVWSLCSMYACVYVCVYSSVPPLIKQTMSKGERQRQRCNLVATL